MQMRTALAAAGAGWLAAAALAASPAAAPDPGVASAAPAYRAPGAAAHGYLRASQVPDAGRMIGPPPSDESGTKAGDLATYRATRSLEGTPRWALASRDAEFGPAPMLAAFSCAVGVTLDKRHAPALYRLASRLVVDSDAVNGKVKAGYRRIRPFVENGGHICEPEADWLKNSYSYPSGHTTYSWSTGLVLEEIAPDLGSRLLSRARSYGESRVVCGVHYPSDVWAGRAAASALVGRLQSSALFRADLAAARREMARLRARPGARPDPGQCAVEAQASATPVW